jgi:general nucleoside transport system permease protein
MSKSVNKEPIDWNAALKEILSGGVTRTVVSVILGFAVGAFFMIISNREFLQSIGYFFADPLASLRAAGDVVGAGYGALIQGSVYNPNAATFEGAIRPLTETLRLGAPLIAAGLGIGLGFRVGLFNIGGTGQTSLWTDLGNFCGNPYGASTRYSLRGRNSCSDCWLCLSRCLRWIS